GPHVGPLHVVDHRVGNALVVQMRELRGGEAINRSRAAHARDDLIRREVRLAHSYDDGDRDALVRAPEVDDEAAGDHERRGERHGGAAGSSRVRHTVGDTPAPTSKRFLNIQYTEYGTMRIGDAGKRTTSPSTRRTSVPSPRPTSARFTVMTFLDPSSWARTIRTWWRSA